MDIALTKMSSKGQIVIPVEMRKGLREGEKLLILRDNSLLIIKKASTMDAQLKEDLAFARRTEEAWQRYERGEFISMDSKDFLKELEQW